MARILVQDEGFDTGGEIARLGRAGSEAGAIGCFVGVVRSDVARPIIAMTLEHYPAMTQAALARIAEMAEARFALLSCTIIHRVGRLAPGEQIVFVGASARHRHAALDAVAFLMDWLKTKAPFWKQEVFTTGESRWVEARDTDDEAAARWTSAS